MEEHGYKKLPLSRNMQISIVPTNENERKKY
jgi:hypothetical protein